MTKVKKITEKCLLIQDVKLSFFDLWEPSALLKTSNGKAKYSVELLVPKEDPYNIIVDIRNYLDAYAKEELGKKTSYLIRIMDGDAQTGSGGAPHPNPHSFRFGQYYFRARSVLKPKLIGQNGQEADPIEDPFYMGVRVHVWVDMFAYPFDKSANVGFSLLAVQKFKDDSNIHPYSTTEITDFEDYS